VAEYTALKYRAFVSCSERDQSGRDQAWAKWLHGALDAYPIDGDLIGRWTAAGPVPKALRPIFRNREDGSTGITAMSSAGRPLTDQTIAALQASRCLIVICSPEAVKSARVNEEIRQFNAMGRADRVIPVIVDGEVGHPERECLPPVLRFRLGPDRELMNEVGELIGADPRSEADGKELAVHKVVAALLEVPFEELEQRAGRLHRRRMFVRYGAVAGLLALTLACQSGVALFRGHLAENEALLDHTLARASSLTSQAVAVSEQLGVPHGITAGLLGDAESMLKEWAELAPETPRLRLRKASMLIALARNYATLDNPELLQQHTTQAMTLMDVFAADAPIDLAFQNDLAVAYDQLGDVLQTQGRLKDALASYRASAAIAERLADDPSYTGRQHDLAVNYIKVGDIDLARGALEEALVSYGTSYDLAQRLVNVDPGNGLWQDALLAAQQKIGDVQRMQGELDAALASYQAARGIAARFVTRDGGDAAWQRRLATAHVKVGDVLAVQNKSHEALASYRASHAIAERFAENGGIGWQSDLGISLERIGAILESQGDLVGALKEYRASLAIANGLAAADRGSASRQRTLGIAYEHVGDVLRALDDLGGALKAYDAKRAIISRLAEADPTNTLWQYDLGVSHARIGLVHENRGDFAAALEAYQTCLGIGTRLAAADPDNAGWMRDLAISYGKLAAAYHRLGKTGQALVELRKGRSIMVALVATAPGFVPWAQDLARLDDRIAAIEGRGRVVAQGPGKEAAKEPTERDAAKRDVVFDLRDRIGSARDIPAKVSN
jgi:tetratricopeptide (TPR) repeat protein